MYLSYKLDRSNIKTLDICFLASLSSYKIRRFFINNNMTFKEYFTEKSVHDPVRPGILKRQVKGKMTCSKARGIKSKQKNKGNNTAKAAQRYLNYHC